MQYLALNWGQVQHKWEAESVDALLCFNVDDRLLKVRADTF